MKCLTTLNDSFFTQPTFRHTPRIHIHDMVMRIWKKDAVAAAALLSRLYNHGMCKMWNFYCFHRESSEQSKSWEKKLFHRRRLWAWSVAFKVKFANCLPPFPSSASLIFLSAWLPPGSIVCVYMLWMSEWASETFFPTPFFFFTLSRILIKKSESKASNKATTTWQIACRISCCLEFNTRNMARAQLSLSSI